jgi:formate--tetrahydrofolate ligase
MAALLREALKPNLVQTLEHTPAFVHGGPFANIAHGCNSVVATRLALGLSEYVVTEAGFGADLGAEKFCDIVCRQSGLRPNAVAIVATMRALRRHGGAEDPSQPDPAALRRGMPNLMRHISTITSVFGLPAVVAVNSFHTDTPAELEVIQTLCAQAGVKAIDSPVWARGGKGAIELAEEVIRLCDEPAHLRFAYELNQPLMAKIEAIARRVYRADGVEFTPDAAAELEALQAQGFGQLPVCVAKTPFSFSDDPKLLGAPEGFTVTVRGVRVSAGAGFVVALTGTIQTLPGLPKSPAAARIDVDAEGVISGLF